MPDVPTGKMPVLRPGSLDFARDDKRLGSGRRGDLISAPSPKYPEKSATARRHRQHARARALPNHPANAAIPVICSPSMSRWTSWVPS